MQMVREESHHLGLVAIKALLAHRDADSHHWTYMIPALEAALLSPSQEVQSEFVSAVYEALENITTFNGEEENEVTPISMQPVWDVAQKL